MLPIGRVGSRELGYVVHSQSRPTLILLGGIFALTQGFRAPSFLLQGGTAAEQRCAGSSAAGDARLFSP